MLCVTCSSCFVLFVVSSIAFCASGFVEYISCFVLFLLFRDSTFNRVPLCLRACACDRCAVTGVNQKVCVVCVCVRARAPASVLSIFLSKRVNMMFCLWL